MRRAMVAALAAAAVVGTGCATADTTEPAAARTQDETVAASPSPEPPASPSPSASPSDEPAASPAPSPGPALSDAELAELGVNEIGRVLVMEWHKIQDVDGRWENSLETFRAQLRELYDRGYRPVSADEFIDGTFPIPAGTSPVLLTFDDSYKEHFFFGDDGEPHPDSVVGILQAMEREDPTFRARAVFAFYWPYPFRETDRDLIERKLRWLVEHGFDLSNHTYTHDNLRDMTDAEVVDNLSRAEAELREVVGADHRIRVMTLTQGIWPKNEELAMRGEGNGIVYEHDIALEVGFMPTRSPHHAEYDPRSVQRVQAYLPEYEKWVAWLDETPGRRFVSDGDPATVTYPTSFADVAAPMEGFEVRTYDPGPGA